MQELVKSSVSLIELSPELRAVNDVQDRSHRCWKMGPALLLQDQGPISPVVSWKSDTELSQYLLTVQKNFASFPRVMTAPSEFAPIVWRIQLKAPIISWQNLVFNLFSGPILMVMIYNFPFLSTVRFEDSNSEAMVGIQMAPTIH
jgi:hypothetical protein